jgi:quercetin 2,3-dioxygenase
MSRSLFKEVNMPAVTADTLTLPRVGAARPGDTERPVQSISTGPRGYEGEGFPVVRAFAGVSTAALDPFVHMDQMGEVDYQPGEPRGTDWHPHRGFETVTYMIDGKFAHQDSHGGGGLIADGATQWMTAGSGILHIETPPAELVDSGGLFHGVQLWVNLPKTDKFTAPRYQAIERNDVALLASDDGGALVRIIAGEIDGHHGPGVTHTPITMAHATIEGGARVNLPWRPDYNALVYVLSGRGYVGADGHPIEQGQLAVLGAGDRISIGGGSVRDSSRFAGPIDVLILGGRPIREPVFHYGPFVMNSKTELMTALDDFRAGKFGQIPPNALMPHRGVTQSGNGVHGKS